MSHENLTQAQLIRRLKALEGRANPSDMAERLCWVESQGC